MSHSYKKIEYNEEGAYGSVYKRTLYCHKNNTCDVTLFYDDKGDFLFSFPDTLDGNLFERMQELVNTNSSLEQPMSPEEIKLIKR